MLIILQREPSPPIPTLQKKQTNLVPSGRSSVVSQLSPRTVSQFVMGVNIQNFGCSNIKNLTILTGALCVSPTPNSHCKNAPTTAG